MITLYAYVAVIGIAIVALALACYWHVLNLLTLAFPRPSAITLDSTSVMALAQATDATRPHSFCQSNRPMRAHATAPLSFTQTISVKLRLARPYCNEPVFSRPARCSSRIGAKRNRHTLHVSPRHRSEVHNS